MNKPYNQPKCNHEKFVSTNKCKIPLKAAINQSTSLNRTNPLLNPKSILRQRCISNVTTGIERMVPLPCSFCPGPFDVICARGKQAKNHPGNKYFRSMVKQSVEKYSRVTSRIEKSIVVSDIVDTIRMKSPHGGFVKEENGQWYEVGDNLAREKVGQSLRDLLHIRYKSSTKAKRQRRLETDAKIQNEMETILQENEAVSQTIKELSETLKIQEPDTSDDSLSLLMTQANCDILESLKNDQALQSFVHENSSSLDSSGLNNKSQKSI